MPELVERVPKDQVDLKVLLADGDGLCYNFLFQPSSTIREVSLHVHQHWPSEWEESFVSKPDNSQLLKFIYRGRFLGQEDTLTSLSIPVGKTTVLHMVVRERVPENPLSGVSSKSKASNSTETRCCVIL